MKYLFIKFFILLILGCSSGSKITVYPDGLSNEETAITFNSMKEYEEWGEVQKDKALERVAREGIEVEAIAIVILIEKFASEKIPEALKYYVSILGENPSESLLKHLNAKDDIFRPGSHWEKGTGMTILLSGFHIKDNGISVNIGTYCGPLCSSSTTMYLEKKDGKWKILDEKLEWIS